MAKSGEHKFSYAYVAKDSGEICTVEVALSVGENKMKVFIKPNEEINIEEDLPEILKQIEKNQLSRVGLQILTDCEIYVDSKDASGNLKKVELIDENFTIKK